MNSKTQAQPQISSWAIAGACIVGFTLAACATQFSALVDIPGWAAFVIVGALTVDVACIALTHPVRRGKALAYQGMLLAGLAFFALALGALQVLAILVQPATGVPQAMSTQVATWVVMFGGSLMLAAMAFIDARESRKA